MSGYRWRDPRRWRKHRQPVVLAGQVEQEALIRETVAVLGEALRVWPDAWRLGSDGRYWPAGYLPQERR